MTDFNQRSENRGVAASVSNILSDGLGLLRGELALARTEMGEKISGLIGAVMMLVIGLALVMAALVVLLDALVYSLVETGIHAGFAALIVGGGTVILGAVLMKAAQSRFKPENLMPEKTAAQLRKDSETLKEVRK